MKKRVLLLLTILLLLPLTVPAQEAGKAGDAIGMLSGQIVNDAGVPLPGGVVSFFFSEKGSPMVGTTHRLPDMVGRMDTQGRFALKLAPGTYYIGALVITDPGRGPGPPRKGELFYFVRDAEGKMREFAVKANEAMDVGKLNGVTGLGLANLESALQSLDRLAIPSGGEMALAETGQRIGEVGMVGTE